MKKIMVFASFVLLFLAMAASAHAVSLTSGLFDFNGKTRLSDNSAELLFNVDGSVDINGAPTVTSGDIFVGILGINTIEHTTGPAFSQTIGAATSFAEITAIQAFKVDTVTPITGLFVNGFQVAIFTEVPLTAADSGTFDFAAYNSVGLTNDGKLFALVFEDTGQDYTRDSTVAAGENSADNGSLRLGLSIIPDNGDYLSTQAPQDLAAFGTITAGDPMPHSSIDLDGTITYQNWPGLSFFSDVKGGVGGFAAPSTSSGFPVFDNLDIDLRAVPTAVPEPGTLSLMGIGLLAACVYGRKRRG